MSDVTTRLEAAIERLRPAIQMDGGDLELVGFDEASGQVRVVMLGACVGCGLSEWTLQHGVERTLKELVPEVREVVAL